LPISPARTTAYRILRRVEAGRAFAVDLLQSQEVSALKEADRRLATELVMGVLRWRGELDFQVREVSGRPVEGLDPEVATILRLGVYQIQFLERVPKAATVNEAVEMTKAARKGSATGLVNAVLRRCPPARSGLRSRRFEDLDKATLASVRRATPAWLLKRWAAIKRPLSPIKTPVIVRDVRSQLSAVRCNEPLTTDDGLRTTDEDVALRLAWASTQVPPTVLRVVNPAQDIPRLREELAAEGIKTSPGKFSHRALVVESGNVQASHALRQGEVVIQDEASQLVADLLMPEAGQRVLDLCAAPGIKAGQIAHLLGSGTLVTCDRSASRLRTMARLLPPWLPKAVQWLAIQLDATQALPFRGQFERILLDAPCSGTGTLARNPEIKWRLRQADLKRLAEAQVKMLKSALGALCRAGRLVYATCSLEPEENEGVVERVLEEYPGYRVVSPAELESAYSALTPLFDPQGYLRTRPDLHTMDGFFAAVIVRKNQ
jgi:16S rRNA (cytosine967-C5)-methyltransferase